MSRSSSKHMSARLARMWNSKSPGVATAVCAGPRISANGRSCAGRRGCPNRSQAALPIATLHDSRPCKSRNPTVRSSPPISAITPRTLRTASAVPPIDTTRNIAARDSGARMLCGSIGTRSEESTIGNDFSARFGPGRLAPGRLAPSDFAVSRIGPATLLALARAADVANRRVYVLGLTPPAPIPPTARSA